MPLLQKKERIRQQSKSIYNMISTIVSEFKRAAQAHKAVKGFTYDNPSKKMGFGEAHYPHIFLEEPIISQDFDTEVSGLVEFTASVDVLLFGVDNLSLQTQAETILYQVIAKINDNEMIRINSLNIVSLSRYNDDNTAGVRATISVSALNDYMRCVDEEEFDPNKEFETNDVLPDINTDGAESCDGKYGKLSEIDL